MNLNIELLKITDKITYSDIFHFPTIVELEEKINSTVDKTVYSKIENLSDSYLDILKDSTQKDKIKKYHPKNILLTGATGFLGMHILNEFIQNERGKIYCIIRNEPGITARTKLYQKLNYYFGDKYNDLIDNRIFAVTGDITKPGFGLNQEDLLKMSNSINIVVHSAANVSHFGNYRDFYDTNVKSVKYIINFCNSFHKKLYHISTISVSGEKLDTSYLAHTPIQQHDIVFNESSLYVGQILDNVYAHSKFDAEHYVLDAISKGLDGYILRMGHLMPRYKDGIFQENLLDNHIANQIISLIKIGNAPNYLLKQPLEITPIDFAASAVYKLITHPSNSNRVFHIYNHNTISVEKYIKIFKKMNININVLPEQDFQNVIKSILKDDDSKNLLNNLINDFDKDLHFHYNSDIMISSNFTINYLRKINFKWPKISDKYLIRFINLLKKVI